MSQSDVLIFMNVASWVFILFFIFYFFLYSKFLPSFFKNMRIQFFAEVLMKRQFFNFFLNFLDKLFWYKTTFRKFHMNMSFMKQVGLVDFTSLYKQLQSGWYIKNLFKLGLF